MRAIINEFQSFRSKGLMGIQSYNKKFQRVVEFPDNRVMIDLCGQFDCNLSKIEHEISVQVLRRGNIFEISGDQENCRLAVTVLQSLYSQIASGKVLETGDIDATIRIIYYPRTSKTIYITV